MEKRHGAFAEATSPRAGARVRALFPGSTFNPPRDKLNVPARKSGLPARKLDLHGGKSGLPARICNLRAGKLDLHADKSNLHADKLDLLHASKLNVHAGKLDLPGAERACPRPGRGSAAPRYPWQASAGTSPGARYVSPDGPLAGGGISLGAMSSGSRAGGKPRPYIEVLIGTLSALRGPLGGHRGVGESREGRRVCAPRGFHLFKGKHGQADIRFFLLSRVMNYPRRAIHYSCFNRAP